MLTPPFLKKGDIIGIAATARKISTDELNYAVKLIESKGYQVQFSTNLFAIENQFAKIIRTRADADIVLRFSLWFFVDVIHNACG